MNQINHDNVAIIMENSLHSRRTCMACACELWASDHGLYRKLGRMAAMVRAAMDMGKEPAFLLHLRFWSAEWISRSPTDADGMGFWVRPIAQRVWPTE